jgi:hypothetical protein
MWCRMAGHQASGRFAVDCAAKHGITNSSGGESISYGFSIVRWHL